MKNILSLILVSIFSSIATLGIYKQYIEEKPSPVKDVILKDPSYAKQINHPYNMRPNFHPNITNVSSFTDAANEVRPCVVHIKSSSGDRYERLFGGEATGSGVIISKDGYIVTNNHVIAGAQSLTITLNNKRTYEASIIGTDKTTDLAVIKINKEDLKDTELPTLQYGNSEQTLVGDWVLAVGNPFNLTSTVTAGIVSAKGRNIDILEGTYSIESFIQTDAVVNPGNSGGALVNTEGELVGINTAIVTRSGRYEGYSFAVPSNLVKKVVKDLIDYGEVQRGFLGITIRDVDDEIADENKLKDLNGVYVDGVGEESAAEEAGLQEGDVIIKVNGKRVSSSPELQEQVGLFRPGEKVAVIFMRDGKMKTTEVLLKNSENTTTLGKKRAEKKRLSKKSLLKELGIKAEALSKNDQKRLNTIGVIITNIDKNSIIADTNMEENFIVTAVNSKKVSSIEEFINAVVDTDGEVVLDGFYEEYTGEFSYVFDK